MECAGLLPITEATKKLYITEYQVPEKFDLISISGGVGEYIDKKEANSFLHGDMGIILGEAIQDALEPYENILYIPKEKIRATVIGAGTHSLCVSGSTIGFDESLLPMKNVPIIKVFSGEEDYTKIFERAKGKMDFYIEENIAIGFRGEKSPSYQCLCNIAIQIIELYEGKKSPIIVLLEEDFAKALSQVIRRLAKPNTKIICLDKIVTINGDYIDIGEPIMSAIPVVIKTLIYQS